jgi:hypothetical protein
MSADTHSSWTKSMHYHQRCDGCDQKARWNVLYMCTIPGCKLRICKGCATDKKFERPPPARSHVLDANSVDWCREMKSSSQGTESR